MGLKSKTTAAVASLFIISSTVSAQANSSAISNVCAGGFAGCVLPGKTAPAPATSVPAAAETIVEEAEKGGFSILAPLLGAAAVIAGILIISGDDDEAPVSP